MPRATTATDLPAYLKAWIDWNGKGALEAAEQVVNSTVPSGHPSVSASRSRCRPQSFRIRTLACGYA